MKEASGNIKIVLVDDHNLFRKGMMELINGFSGFTVIWEAENGKDFTLKIAPDNVPDIVLLDISMPVMDGFQTAEWLGKYYPDVMIMALTMHNDDSTVLQMLQAGVNGYVVKNIDPTDLEKALRILYTEGTYYTSRVAGLVVKKLYKVKKVKADLLDREIEFLKLACTELPYKSFATFLGVQPRIVESIRDTLFKKLNVQSRVGLVIYAIKHEIFTVE